MDAETLIHVDAYETGKHRLPLLKPVLYYQLRSLPLVTTEQNGNGYRGHDEYRYQHIRDKVAHVVVALLDSWEQNIRVVISGDQKVERTHGLRNILEIDCLVRIVSVIIYITKDPVAHESEEQDNQGNEEEQLKEISGRVN